ncbi:ANTAR domain-containing protein [Actinoplanes sp. TFC3]|uniref:ANTAR domain-containing protein n=1 Tax=Actinoplanes sp. TFC3 TaxID=1710355 RepID=UPI001F387936|nr:GAF and ANTAR domain-containing protein [Actinoplanes sp. TFC3]
MSAPQRSTGRRSRRAIPATDVPPPTRIVVRGRVKSQIAVAPLPATAMPEPPHPVEVAGLLHELSAQLLGAEDVPEALNRLATLGAQAIRGTLRCSAALIGEGGPPTLAASGPEGAPFDDVQYESGNGPSLEAARTRAVVTAHDLFTDVRWPHLNDCARTQGVRGVLAIPLDIQRSAVGSVSFFVAQPAGLDPELLLTAMAMVNQAEVLFGELQRRQSQREGAAVDRAAGVIIAQRGCGVQEAYDILRDTSQRLGLPREEVADRLIAAAARRNG